jgi:myo-inositol-1(or 4)-monophosphatase
MKETAEMPFPQDDVESRLSHLMHVLPGLGMNMLSFQKEVHIARSFSAMADRELMKKAELQIEDSLIGTIRDNFGRDRVYSEERGRSGADDGEFEWWLDPLDGTRNYIHGVPLFCISVGLCFRGSPVGGVVMVPAFSDMYHAILGAGAFKNHNAIRVSGLTSIERTLIATGLPYQRKEMIAEIIADVAAFITSGTGLRRTGSAVLDLCWLAEGRFDAMWERGMAPHDLCAASVILSEAGGRLSGFDGQGFDIFFQDVIASNGLLHPQLIELLGKARKVEGMN